ncbi:MAG: hypothetical protein NTX50_13505 [Candidatus Sumerlaeota bacterium]|nr:hypothetical protein [Candidatus Sumerlaeota bacterium]
MGKRLFPEDKAWQTTPLNVMLLGFLMVTLTAILVLFTSYTNNLDEIKPTLQFMLLPLCWLGFFYILFRGEAAPIPPRIWLPIIGFVIVSLISSFTAFKPWRAWFTNSWYYAVFAPFFIVTACIKTEKIFRKVVTIYVGICLAVVLFGLFHYYGGCRLLINALFPLGPPLYRSRIYDLLYTLASNHEMFSTILNSDFYAAFLVIVFPLAVNLFMAPFRSWWEPILGFTTAVLAGISIVLARSNDADGVLFLIVIFYFVMSITIGHVLSKKPDVLWAMVIGLSLLLLVFMVMLWWWMKPQFLMITKALQSRAILFQCAIDTFREGPKNMILGSGPGGYLVCAPFHLRENYFENGIANVNLYAHNQYLDVLCEQGILGLLCYLAFLGTMLWMGFRQILRRGSEFLRIQQIGLMAGILGCLIQDTVSPNMRWTVCGVNHWFQFGLAISCAMLGMRNEDLEARAAAAGAAAAALPKTPADPVFQRSPLGRVSPVWNRRLGITGMILSGLLALYLLFFGVCYFASAYYNNEGIIQIQYASQMGVDQQPRAAENYQAAIQSFKQAIDWWPGFITSYYKMAHAYSMLVQYSEAVKAYDELEKFAPGYSETWFNYGIVYGVLARNARDPKSIADNLRLSLSYFERALKMEKKLNVQQSVAQAYQFAAQRAPNVSDEERRTWMARSWEILYLCAMRRYTMDEDIKPHQELRVGVARSLLSAANQAERDKDDKLRKQYLGWTVNVCTKIIDEDNNHDDGVVSMKTESLSRLGRSDEAFSYIQKELADNPISISFNRILANIYVETKQHAKASEQYERLAHLIEVVEKTQPVVSASTPALDTLKSEIKGQSSLECLLRASSETLACSDTARAKMLYERVMASSPGSPEANVAKISLEKMLSPAKSVSPDKATTPSANKPVAPSVNKPMPPSASKPVPPSADKRSTSSADKRTTPGAPEQPANR